MAPRSYSPFSASPTLGDPSALLALDARQHACPAVVEKQLRVGLHLMVCFGSNRDGQCDVPPDLGPVKAVAAGWSHTCAVKADGELVCFGGNKDGQCHVPPDLGRVTADATGNMAPIVQNMTLILQMGSQWPMRLWPTLQVLA